MTPSLSVLERERLAERASALKHLLAHPLTLATEAPERFVSILRHREWLVTWFADHAGWKLSVEPSAGFARLLKVAASDERRPARPHGRQDFDPRGPMVFGRSITDACLGWESTLPIFERLAAAVRARRNA